MSNTTQTTDFEPSERSDDERSSASRARREMPADTVDGMMPGVELDADAVPEGSPLKQMLMIAAPSIVTMTSYTVMQFTDRLMVKEIGPGSEFVAAQGTAGITTWMFMTFCVGVTGVVSSFVSQNFGAGKPERGGAYAWNAMYLGIAYWAVVMLPGVFLARWVFSLYALEANVLSLAVSYAQISFAGAVFTLMAKGLHNYFFGLHRPGIVMIAVIVANVTNIFLNTVFMFGPEGLDLGYAPGEGGVFVRAIQSFCDAGAWVAGSFGVPAMGLRGAAVATVLGTMLEFGIPFAVFFLSKVDRAHGSHRSWRLSFGCLRDLAKVGWPGGLMFVNDLVCWTYMMQVLTPKGAKLAAEAAGQSEEAIRAVSTNSLTTGHIAIQWMHLSFMPAVGLAIAAQAMVGKAVGAKRPELAEHHTWLATKLTMVYMGVCALGFVLFGRELMGVFINAEAPEAERAMILSLGVRIMYAAAVFQLFDALAITMSSALRGAGDTVWPGVASVVLSWGCIIGFGHLLLAVLPQTGGLAAWIGASAYIVALGVVLLVRFLRGRWKELSLVHEEQDGSAVTA